MEDDLIRIMGDNYHTESHKDGIPWDEAPIPRRWHRCKVQTEEWFGLRQYPLCSCGGLKTPYGWTMKNSRRKS